MAAHLSRQRDSETPIEATETLELPHVHSTRQTRGSSSVSRGLCPGFHDLGRHSDEARHLNEIPL